MVIKIKKKIQSLGKVRVNMLSHTLPQRSSQLNENLGGVQVLISAMVELRPVLQVVICWRLGHHSGDAKKV
jgi:hypothetical protein